MSIIFSSTHRSLLILFFLLIAPLPVQASFPDCKTAQTFLTSKRWINYETGNHSIFISNGASEGVLVVNSAFRHPYKLERKSLFGEERKFIIELCQITVSYQEGDCIGDVDGYFLETIGNSVRFKWSYVYIGSSGSDIYWEPDNISKKCERGSTFSLSPER